MDIRLWPQNAFKIATQSLPRWCWLLLKCIVLYWSIPKNRAPIANMRRKDVAGGRYFPESIWLYKYSLLHSHLKPLHLLLNRNMQDLFKSVDTYIHYDVSFQCRKELCCSLSFVHVLPRWLFPWMHFTPCRLLFKEQGLLAAERMNWGPFMAIGVKSAESTVRLDWNKTFEQENLFPMHLLCYDCFRPWIEFGSAGEGVFLGRDRH